MSVAKVVDHYATLGVARTATDEEIRAAFKGIARETHPDTHPDDPESEARYKAASEAHATLTGDRDAYDADLRDSETAAASAQGPLDPETLESVQFLQDLGVAAMNASREASAAGIPLKEQAKNVGVSIWNALKTPEGKATAAGLFGSFVRTIAPPPPSPPKPTTTT